MISATPLPPPKSQTKTKTVFRPADLINLFIFKDFIYLFLEKGEGREKERERSLEVREKH